MMRLDRLNRTLDNERDGMSTYGARPRSANRTTSVARSRIDPRVFLSLVVSVTVSLFLVFLAIWEFETAVIRCQTPKSPNYYLLFVAKIGFWIGPPADSVRWFPADSLFSIFLTFRRLKGQNSSDVDQIVGNHAQSDPSFHAVVAPISTPIQPVSSFEHTDPAFASSSPGLCLSEPSLFL